MKDYFSNTVSVVAKAATINTATMDELKAQGERLERWAELVQAGRMDEANKLRAEILANN